MSLLDAYCQDFGMSAAEVRAAGERSSPDAAQSSSIDSTSRSSSADASAALADANRDPALDAQSVGGLSDEARSELGQAVRAVHGADSVTLPGAMFNRPVNPFVLYQVVRWQRAKARQVWPASWSRHCMLNGP